MNRIGGIILCLAYILGLFSTGFLNFSQSSFPWQGLLIIAFVFLGFGLAIPLIGKRFCLTAPQIKIWILAATIAIFAVVYFQLRLPQPSTNDISHILTQSGANSHSQIVRVEGKILSQTRLTRKQKVQFELAAEKVSQVKENTEAKLVTGKLYVTVPLLQGTGLYPGKKVTVTGILYAPQPATNPGAFDFQKYLSSQGIFAGLSGFEANLNNNLKRPNFGFWQLRQKLVRAQVRWLGSPEGALVSSIVLGRQAVDLPYDISDRFTKVGLAHVLAVSGFHISLLLGIVIKITERFASRTRLIIGIIALILYVAFTGAQPSIMRAALMGVGALLALATERKVRPLGSLLLAATILLLLNPLWIWNLGFQLSFLATLGLIITAPVLEKKLDWLPSSIATLIAIPLAASLWTLPLLIYVFNTVSTYSILVNIIATPLIVIISLGGMLSAFVALIFPLAGSAIAICLYYPTHWLIWLVELFAQLPGSALAVGKISLLQMLFIYAVICLVWLSNWWQERWWIAGLFTLTVLVVPIVYGNYNLVEITVLATKEEQVVIVRDRGKTILVNSGDRDTVRYTILPFLARQGINRIDLGIALDTEDINNNAWDEIAANIPIKNLSGETNSLKLPLGKNISIGQTNLELINNYPPILQLHILDRNWLLLGSNLFDKRNKIEFAKKPPAKIDVILWSGKDLSPEWLERFKPKIAIVSSTTISPKAEKQLKQKQIELYWTGRDGAIIWTADKGFQKTYELLAEDASVM
jgi:competence protein ComEC